MTRHLHEDLRYASRLLWRSKSFTVAAVATLALGLAGTTVMFALIRGVLLRPLPVHEQDRLILAWKEAPTGGSARYPFGDREITAVADASRLLEDAAGVTRNGVGRSVLTDAGASTYANVGLVTGGFFDVLGVRPRVGRALSVADDQPGAASVIVISSGLWIRRYGQTPDVIGRYVTLDGQPFAIVGVMPPDLDYPVGVEIWRLTSSVSATGPFGAAARREVNLIGRLRPGVTLAQATSEIVSLNERLGSDTPAMRGLVPQVRSFPDVIVGDVRLAMLALLGAVALVLLIACANVANLLLLRGEARRSEFALRAALGAGRSRIVRQVLAESFVLSILAGAIGVALAWVAVPVLLTIIPDGLPRIESVRVDESVVLFSFAVVLLAAVTAGLTPAFLSSRLDLTSPLRSGGTSASGAPATRGRRTLVVAQVALAVTVLAASGLLIRSVINLHAIDLGLSADRLVLLDLYIPAAKYAARPQRAQLLDDVIARFEAIPEIAAATPVNVSPFTDRGWDVPRVTAEGQGPDDASANPGLNLESVYPNYFATFEVPIVIGRPFTASDRQGTTAVAIVSEDLASRLWPREDAIGKRVKMGPVEGSAPWLEVVGVAAPTRYRTVTAPRPTLYLPAAQFQVTATMLAVRTTASIEWVASAAAARIRTIDSDIQVMRVASFDQLLQRPLARPRFMAFLLSVFGVAALLLATVGLYAVIAAHTKQREREIALRVALGATAQTVRHLVLSETLKLAVLGALIGVGSAIALTRLLQGMLFEVDPLDPATIAASAAVLVFAAAIAAYGPARRAPRADLMTILRRQ